MSSPTAPPEATSVPRIPWIDGDSPEWDPAYAPNMDDLVTEDDTPVDNIFSEKQQQLLVEPLSYSKAWPGEGRAYLVLANVGLFYQSATPGIAPDVMVALDVRLGQDPHLKENRSYFVWMQGKAPDAAVEIVSNLKGGEGDRKLALYERIGVRYYIIYDPENLLKAGTLRVFGLNGAGYGAIAPDWLPGIGLGVKLWKGIYKNIDTTWVRWCDQNGNLLPLPAEQADEERQRAEQERERADRLVAQLRALGIEPTS